MSGNENVVEDALDHMYYFLYCKVKLSRCDKVKFIDCDLPRLFFLELLSDGNRANVIMK